MALRRGTKDAALRERLPAWAGGGDSYVSNHIKNRSQIRPRIDRATAF